MLRVTEQQLRSWSRQGLIHTGALSFSFAEPEDAAHWVAEYYDLIASPECVPRGFAVNPNVAVVLPMMLHPDEATAIDRGIDGAHFFGYSLGHFYGTAHLVGGTDLWQSFGRDRAEQGFARDIVSASAAPLAVRLLQEGIGSLRGAIGTPEQVADLIARYEAAGVDQVMFVMQAGKNRHEHICESIELFAREVLPRFAEGREEKEAAKADKLAAVIDKALARRSGPRVLPSPYRIDEDAELAAARQSAHLPLRELAGQARQSAGESARGKVQSGARRLIGKASDRRLEQLFSSRQAQRAVFALMASRFDPAHASGFEGAIRYDLGLGDGTRRSWLIEVRGGRARAREGAGRDAALTIRVPLIDFIKTIADARQVMPLIRDGIMTLEGDLGLASRMAEMFGSRPVY